ILNRETGGRIDSAFRNLPDFLLPSDVLVLNDTRVIRARIHGKLERAGGSTREIEVLFAAPAGANTWEVMCKPGKRIRAGDRVVFGDGVLQGTFGEARAHGLRVLNVKSSAVDAFLEQHGHVPIPPYFQREDTPSD